MEVHHHAHSERKKWTHYFWEFFMLFLAVTLGFFVENQREHYVERQRAKEFAYNLIFDLSNDTSRLNYLSNYQTWKENNLDTLIMLLNSGENEYNASLFYQTIRALDSWKITTGYSNTYDDLKTSGLIRYYTRNGLANKLKSYYGEYIDLVSQEKEAEKFHMEICEPFLDKHFNGMNSVSEINGRPESNKFLFPVPADKKIVIPEEIRKILLNITIRLKYKKGMYKNLDNYRKQKETSIALIKQL